MLSKYTRSKGVIAALRDGRIQVLFVSPERLVTQHFEELLSGLPPVRLVCIDEAHCVSEWSHNFRPCYLRLSNALSRLGLDCVLAMTGLPSHAFPLIVTRTNGPYKSHGDQVSSIGDFSDLQHFGGKLVYWPRNEVEYQNFHLGTQRQVCGLSAVHSFVQPVGRNAALVQLLSEPPFASLKSVIVYCMRQNQADEIASLLRVRRFSSESYHAGKNARERKRIQNDFMSGKIAIVVATIAFGMGLDKADVRAVVHYSLPRSIENFVQVGLCPVLARLAVLTGERKSAEQVVMVNSRMATCFWIRPNTENSGVCVFREEWTW